MAESSQNLTPLMRQYWDIKSLHKDKILLFRMGDFYEIFFEDAVIAAPILGIALTSRNKKSQDETPMCGFPHHAVAGPINKLLKQGLRVAICDQIEDPKLAKGIVKRAVTRVLSPGMVYDSDTLDSTQSHYLASYGNQSLACVDTSTGEAFTLGPVNSNDALRLFSVLPIAEIVISKLSTNIEFLKKMNLPMTLVDSSYVDEPEKILLEYIRASGSGEVAKTLKSFEQRSLQGRMDLSATVLRHLEIFQNSRGDVQGTLFSSIDRTRTSAGARLLRQRLSFPLVNIQEIESRLNQSTRWLNDMALTKRVREVLSSMGDVERRLGKIAQPQCNARDLRALAESCQAGLQALQIAGTRFEDGKLAQLCEQILVSIVDEPPIPVKQGGLIRAGVDAQLDEFISLTTNSQTLLQELETREKSETGISSLKVRYNNVFGFYIEITHTHKDKVPAHYLRKQTLANAERYYTEELIELEKKVLSAQSKRFELEFDIFEQLKKQILNSSSEFLTLAQLTSELDVSTANAWLAAEKNYCRPSLGHKALHIKSSRHPVVEQSVKAAFTPNTIKIDQASCLLLTGPNMAGKSTLMRQVALISIMAQAGMYVPAESAELPVFNHVFTRIGASDQLSEGLSTFMVEMTETAEMLKKAGPQSLLILDEIGRGTSTYDGMSLAQAILEFILKEMRAITLFATHYHELTQLESEFKSVKNAHMKVAEKNSQIEFLHTLAAGPAEKSYGIHVARLAGVPESVNRRASEILKQHEGSQIKTQQLSFIESVPEMPPVIQELMDINVMNITPLQALQKLADLKAQLSVSRDARDMFT